uniref:CUB_2 domain-containing protein n=1 Tax=Rhabditophanes sp. KR3021 TaxID=114890 RepID=A0AC35UCH4_9BILA
MFTSKSFVFALLLVLQLAVLTSCAHSDGKEFVLSLMNAGTPFTNTSTASLIVIPNLKNANCQIEYTKVSNGSVLALNYTAIYGKTNELFLNETDIYHSFFNYNNNITFKVQDPRIFVTCNETVKLIARYHDEVNQFGDMFLVPSIEHAGKNYSIFTPLSTFQNESLIVLLPLRNETAVFNATVQIFSNKTVMFETKISFNTSLGSEHHVISAQSLFNSSLLTSNFTYLISSNHSFMVNAITPYAFNSSRYGLFENKNETSDYTNFMPLPIYNGNSSSIDRRILASNFTSSVHFSASLNSTLHFSRFNVSIYNQQNIGNHSIVNTLGFSNFSFVNSTLFALNTTSAHMSAYRFGGICQNKEQTVNGSFITYVPSTSEFVNGSTQFYTLKSGCLLEVYSQTAISNTLNMFLDGQHIPTQNNHHKNLPFFDGEWQQNIITINGHGIHKFETAGNYSAYVICQHANSTSNGMGYLTGFNNRL